MRQGRQAEVPDHLQSQSGTAEPCRKRVKDEKKGKSRRETQQEHDQDAALEEHPQRGSHISLRRCVGGRQRHDSVVPEGRAAQKWNVRRYAYMDRIPLDLQGRSLLERNIETKIHGRYLVEAPGRGAPMLVGFHGYAEPADAEFARLRSIEGADQWLLVAVQGLHRFYRGRSRDVVASWMTTQDRELAIAENISYTSAVVDDVAKEWAAAQTLVLSGFSQGVAMAWRCATHLARPIHGVIALGGDIPPELDTTCLSRVPFVLLGRGTRDEWYTPDKLAQDQERLRQAGVNREIVTFDGGHEWSAAFALAVARFLEARKRE